MDGFSVLGCFLTESIETEGTKAVIGIMSLCRIQHDDKTVKAVKRALLNSKSNLRSLRDRSFLDIDALRTCQKHAVQNIFQEFDAIQHFSITATSKITHILNPELFVKWNGNILKYYGKQIDKTGEAKPPFWVSFELSPPIVPLCLGLSLSLMLRNSALQL